MRLPQSIDTALTELKSIRILRRAGVLPKVREVPALVRSVRRAGAPSLTTLLGARFGKKTAIIDGDDTAVTYEELATKVSRFTHALNTTVGKEHQPIIGVICRNSRYMVIAIYGAFGVGARLVFLNTDLGSRQLRLVCEREKVELVIHDEEFAGVVGDAAGCRRILAWVDTDPAGLPTVDSMIAEAPPDQAPPGPANSPSIVILTSGSSGTPKGAARQSSARGSLSSLAGLLDAIPLRGSDTTFVGPPAFHGWGLIVAMGSLMLGSTVVFDRKFDAQRTLNALIRHRCTALVAVPTMLKRLASLDEAALLPATKRLRIIASGGARLDPKLVGVIQKIFGHVLYNLYGATEASYITIATPHDLRADPSCAGAPPLGVQVAIMRNGQPVPAGESGDIFVRSGAQISAYTDGQSKEVVAGMIKTADVGRFNHRGALFVEGRSDDMIVSGGENVFPEEVEVALSGHPVIMDAKVVAIDDDEFGQRLAAIVVVDRARTVESAEFRDELRDYIARELSRSRVPREIIVVDAIPRTATGKVTRETVKALFRANEVGSTTIDGEGIA